MKKFHNIIFSFTKVEFWQRPQHIVIYLQSCRENQKDAYREEQCSQYNGHIYGGINYKWKPVDYNLGLSKHNFGSN